MRPLLILLFATLGAPASAHIGHVAEVAGHGHWIGLAAIGLAAAIGLLGGKTEKDPEAEEKETETEEQPA